MLWTGIILFLLRKVNLLKDVEHQSRATGSGGDNLEPCHLCHWGMLGGDLWYSGARCFERLLNRNGVMVFGTHTCEGSTLPPLFLPNKSSRIYSALTGSVVLVLNIRHPRCRRLRGSLRTSP